MVPRWVIALGVGAAIGAIARPVLAQRSSVIDLLQTAPDARLRAQAALTLGRLRPDGATVALEGALSDTSPAVRAAAVEALSAIGDSAALAALRAHTNDHDTGVRTGIERAVADLERRTGAGPSADGPSASSACDMGQARVLVRVGNLSSRAQGDGLVDVLRDAIVTEMGRSEATCAVPGELPPAATARIRSRRARAFSIDGSVSTRQWTVASTLSVRAEVSLVLLSHPSGAMVGSLNGAATAQDAADGTNAAHRLATRALAAAVHGALVNVGTTVFAGR